MNRSIEQSFKSRMRNIATERRIPSRELWEVLVLERLLVRVALSKHADKFVLKGGTLLSRYVNIGRHTQDLDFLVQNMKNDERSLVDVLSEIVAVPLDDGFKFFDIAVRPLSHPHMKYAGTRATMRATFGKTRFKVVVDVGRGDFVEPVNQPLPLLSTDKGPLFESHVEISCYPREFILAEKLEAVVYLESRNSRMKDFHDLYILMQSGSCIGPTFDRVARAVFKHRETALRLPITFTSAELSKLQGLWSRHLDSGLSETITLPTRFEEVVGAVNGWLNEQTSLCINA